LVIFSHPNKDDLEVRKVGKNGPSANEVLEALKSANIPLEHVHFTAMVKHGLGSKSKPTTEDIEEYAAELDAEIEKIKPKLIMPLGAEVFKRVMKSNMKMGDYLGEVIDTPYGKALPNYAPGMITVMDPTKRPEFREIFQLAKRVLDDNLHYDSYRYLVVDDPEVNTAILEKYISAGKFHIG
jgi:uracil-DNA glycosylase family 4